MNLVDFLRCDGVDCFNNDYFNNSLLKKSCAHVFYRNLSIQQHPYILHKFYDLIRNVRPKTIIEVGTFHGGLTLLLSDILNNLSMSDSHIITYDINQQPYIKEIIELNSINNITINSNNLFSSDYQAVVQKDIQSLIQNQGTTLLLCDGGCKVCEFNLLSEFLKPKDIIMAHDYAPDIEYFENNMKDKIWNWCEIKNNDIATSINVNNLVPFMREDFLETAWACFRKEI